MSGHIKGPWNICYDGQMNDSDGNFICSFKWSTYKEFNDSEKNKSIARLIAASPELLIACKAMHNWYKERNLHMGTPFHAILEEVCEAIDKAEGNKP